MIDYNSFSISHYRFLSYLTTGVTIVGGIMKIAVFKIYRRDIDAAMLLIAEGNNSVLQQTFLNSKYISIPQYFYPYL